MNDHFAVLDLFQVSHGTSVITTNRHLCFGNQMKLECMNGSEQHTASDTYMTLLIISVYV
jgi:hypothetical protein